MIGLFSTLMSLRFNPMIRYLANSEACAKVADELSVY